MKCDTGQKKEKLGKQLRKGQEPKKLIVSHATRKISKASTHNRDITGQLQSSAVTVPAHGTNVSSIFSVDGVMVRGKVSKQNTEGISLKYTENPSLQNMTESSRKETSHPSKTGSESLAVRMKGRDNTQILKILLVVLFIEILYVFS